MALSGYRNRREAGERLADELEHYRESGALVLAVPRGGLPVALPLVERYGFELDLLIPRKIGAPFHTEMAIGAVCEDGEVLVNTDLVRELGVSDTYIDEEAGKEVAEIRRRLAAYRGERPPAAVEGRTVVVVDDGVATGFTIIAALKAVARQGPQELVLAVPVGPPDTILMLAKEVDRIVCPLQPDQFYAVGQFYKDFEQLEDSDVREMLKRAWKIQSREGKS